MLSKTVSENKLEEDFEVIDKTLVYFKDENKIK